MGALQLITYKNFNSHFGSWGSKQSEETVTLEFTWGVHGWKRRFCPLVKFPRRANWEKPNRRDLQPKTHPREVDFQSRAEVTTDLEGKN